MAKQKPEVNEEPTTAPEVVEETTVKSGDAGADRKPTVRKEPAQSFDERTGVGTPPWLNEDGTQNRGDVVEAEPTIEGEEASE